MTYTQIVIVAVMNPMNTKQPSSYQALPSLLRVCGYGEPGYEAIISQAYKCTYDYVCHMIIAGGCLNQLLHRFGRFSESVICNYTRQIANGITFLHENGILHRDLKGKSR